MADYLSTLTSELGISLWLLVVIVIWSMIWKLLALWKSARKGSIIWFVVLAMFNTLGILPILYIFVFSKMKCREVKIKKKTIKKKK